MNSKKANQTDFIYIWDDHCLLKYFQNIQKQFIFSNNFGLALNDQDQDSTGKPVLLEKLFVSPSLSETYLNPKELIRVEQQREKIQQANFAQTLKQHQRLFILGDPGTGKTTLINWLMLLLSDTGDNILKMSIGTRIPFAFILREMDLSTVKNWSELCDCYIQQHKKTLTAPFIQFPDTFEHLLKSGQALFLLDGLDEITNLEQRKNLAKIVLDGLSLYPKCQFIITSRLIGFDQKNWFQQLPKEPIAEIYLCPFSQKQVEQFIYNWFNQYVPESQQRELSLNSLIPRLKQNQGLNQLSRVPVLLNMLCFIHTRHGSLPDGRAELYQRISETYLTQLDRARGIEFNQGQPLTFDYTDLSNWLADLALKMQKKRGEENEAIFITEQEVNLFFIERLEEKGLKPLVAEQESQVIIHYLGERSGIFIPKGENKKQQVIYAFTHLSFLEYFAAKALKNKAQFWSNDDKKYYQKQTQNEWWGETFSLFFEQLDQPEQSRFYLDLLFSNKELWTNNDTYPVRLLTQIIMDTGVRLFIKERHDWIEKISQFYLDYDPESIVLLRSIIIHLWGNNFEARSIFLTQAKKYSSLVLMGNIINNISELAKLFYLTKLSLIDTKVTDLTPLNQLKILKTLNLTNTKITDLTSLNQLKTLQTLNLMNTKITDLTPLNQLKTLRTLYLIRTKVMDLTPLNQLETLETLDLSNTKIFDLAPLNQLKTLKQLNLISTKVTDLTPLNQLTVLQKLYLSKNNKTDTSVLSHLKNLEITKMNPPFYLFPLSRGC